MLVNWYNRHYFKVYENQTNKKKVISPLDVYKHPFVRLFSKNSFIFFIRSIYNWMIH